MCLRFQQQHLIYNYLFIAQDASIRLGNHTNMFMHIIITQSIHLQYIPVCTSIYYTKLCCFSLSHSLSRMLPYMVINNATVIIISNLLILCSDVDISLLVLLLLLWFTFQVFITETFSLITLECL